MTRSPSTPMTSSPTLRWLTRAGGGACAGGLTDFSQPIMLKSGSKPCPSALPNSLEEKGSPLHTFPFVSLSFSFASLRCFRHPQVLLLSSYFIHSPFLCPRISPAVSLFLSKILPSLSHVFLSLLFLLTFNNSVVHDGTKMQHNWSTGIQSWLRVLLIAYMQVCEDTRTSNRW